MKPIPLEYSYTATDGLWCKLVEFDNDNGTVSRDIIVRNNDGDIVRVERQYADGVRMKRPLKQKNT